ncbi:MAG: hypothetical protein KJ052_17455, partial [Candidatus Hydrogenedentes bacterium]|nr:hypothetical protein [Candidatus Hydrogenedentota bacterium]
AIPATRPLAESRSATKAASLNIPAGADTPDVQADGDLWADSNEDLRYRRGGADATVYDSVNLPRPAPGEMAAGTETAPRALSAADVREGVALSKMWVSAEQPITAAGSLTLAHPLGVRPVLTIAVLKCVTAEHGYSVGQENIYPYQGYNGAPRGVTAVADNTNVYIKFGSHADIIWVMNFATGGSTLITPANWRLIVRAFA